MSDPSQILIRAEGDTDFTILEELQAGGLLPENLKIARREKEYPPRGQVEKDKGYPGGKDMIIHELAESVKYGGRAVVLRDLDDLQLDQVGNWLSDDLRKKLRKQKVKAEVEPVESSVPRVSVFHVTHGQWTVKVAAVGVGLPDDTELREAFGLEEFVMDDYLLRLARDSQVYEKVAQIRRVAYPTAMKKLDRVLDLMKENKMPVRQSKRLLHLLRGICNMPVSPATFAQRFVREVFQVYEPGHVREVFSPLIDDLEAAAGILST